MTRQDKVIIILSTGDSIDIQMTQRDVVGREVGGEFMFGNSCIPIVDSCQCMAKPIQYCKVKIKIKKKKKRKERTGSIVLQPEKNTSTFKKRHTFKDTCKYS